MSPAERLRVLVGDVGHLHLGLSTPEYRSLCEDATDFVHGAEWSQLSADRANASRRELVAGGIDDRKIVLDLDAKARDWLSDKGYDPAYGARPLKRAVQEHLLDPLATKLLEGEFKPGDRIKVSADGDHLAFAAK